MTLARTFRSGRGAINTIDALDISTGNNVVNLFAANVSGATILTNVSVPSEETVKIIPNSNYANRVEFDMEFTVPQTIKGDVIISTPLCVTSNAGGGRWADLELTGIQKVGTDGTTITHIASGAGTKFIAEGTASGGAIMGVKLSDIDVSFRPKEKLRFFVSSQGDTNGENGIACDPSNRDPWGDWEGMIVDGATTRTTIQVPFKVNF